MPLPRMDPPSLAETTRPHHEHMWEWFDADWPVEVADEDDNIIGRVLSVQVQICVICRNLGDIRRKQP